MNGNRYTAADYRQMVQDATADLKAHGVSRPTAKDIKRHIKFVHGIKLPPKFKPGSKKS